MMDSGTISNSQGVLPAISGLGFINARIAPGGGVDCVVRVVLLTCTRKLHCTELKCVIFSINIQKHQTDTFIL